jgi:hypothetical protein
MRAFSRSAARFLLFFDMLLPGRAMTRAVYSIGGKRPGAEYWSCLKWWHGARTG